MIESKTPLYEVLTGLFGRTPSVATTAEDVEAQAEKELRALVKDRAQEVNFSGEQNADVCDHIFDYNPIHRSAEAAKAFQFGKFKERPIVGPLIIGTAQRVAEATFRDIRDYFGLEEIQNLVVGTKTKFRNPAYPDQKVKFDVIDCKESGGNVVLAVAVTSGRDKIAQVDVLVGPRYRQMPEIGGPIHSEVYEIPQEVINGLNKCIGFEEGRVSPFNGAALVPSALLFMLKERTGSMVGGNLAMETSYLGMPTAGRYQVDIMPPRNIREASRFTLGALVTQETAPIAYTMIKAATPETLKLERDARQFKRFLYRT
ncbi:MAG: MaoC family dehydratase [archaeon]